MFFLQHPELPSTIPVQVTVSQRRISRCSRFRLFILAGNLMNKTGITHDCCDLATVLTGRMNGGLAQV